MEHTRLNELMDAFVEKYGSKFGGFNTPNLVSSILLSKDYINRVLEWKNHLGVGDKPLAIRSRTWHNLFLHFSSIGNNILSIDDFVVLFERRFNLRLVDERIPSQRYHTAFSIYSNILWEYFILNKDIDCSNSLPHPYEGLALIIKQGDRIDFHEFLSVSNVSLRVGNTIGFRLPSIKSDFLEYIDGIFQVNNSRDIPNQAEVNKVWEEFNRLNKV